MLGEKGVHGGCLAHGKLAPYLDDAMKKILAEERPNVRCKAFVFAQFVSSARAVRSSGGSSMAGDGGSRAGWCPCEELDVAFEVHELRG